MNMRIEKVDSERKIFRVVRILQLHCGAASHLRQSNESEILRNGGREVKPSLSDRVRRMVLLVRIGWMKVFNTLRQIAVRIGIRSSLSLRI